MPETDTIPVSASVASTGKGIRYIGDYAYFYGGANSASTTAENHIDFTSGAGFIVGRVYVNGSIESGSGSGEITTFQINLMVLQFA